MRVCSVIWSDSRGEAYIKCSKDFLESDWIVKLDALSDAISDLTDMYKKMIKEGPEIVANALGHFLDE